MRRSATRSRRRHERPGFRYRIKERGRLEVGACADLLLFDPETVGRARLLLQARDNPSEHRASRAENLLAVMYLIRAGIACQLLILQLLCS